MFELGIWSNPDTTSFRLMFKPVHGTPHRGHVHGDPVRQQTSG
jgi:hypothetical protein